MARSIINDGAINSDAPMSSINVTSLVDVMMCLLIMFMVATPLMAPEGVKVELPAARGEKFTEEEFNTKVVSIDAKGQVFLGSLPLARDADKLANELSKNLGEAQQVFLQADQSVSMGRMIDVLVALKDAKISDVGFIIDPNTARIAAERAANGAAAGGKP
jgi:biopolymer transport protein ExbD